MVDFKDSKILKHLAVRTAKDHAGAAFREPKGPHREEHHFHAPQGAQAPGLRFTTPIAVMEPFNQHIAERYRALFSNIEELALKQEKKVFVVTSAVKGEGKSVTSLNLAYVIARDFRKRVALIECDLRKPSTFSAHLEAGRRVKLSDIAASRTVSADSMPVRVDETELYILESGEGTENPPEFFGSAVFRSFIEILREDFDYVLLDSPPLLPFFDASMISRVSDGVIMVVRSGKTPKAVFGKAAKSIPPGNLIGVVLNGMDEKLARYYSYYYD